MPRLTVLVTAPVNVSVRGADVAQRVLDDLLNHWDCPSCMWDREQPPFRAVAGGTALDCYFETDAEVPTNEEIEDVIAEVRSVLQDLAHGGYATVRRTPPGGLEQCENRDRCQYTSIGPFPNVCPRCGHRKIDSCPWCGAEHRVDQYIKPLQADVDAKTARPGLRHSEHLYRCPTQRRLVVVTIESGRLRVTRYEQRPMPPRDG